MMRTFLEGLVVRKIEELGREKAAEFFEVSDLRVAQWQNGSKPVSLAAVERVFSPDLFQHRIEEASWEGKNIALCLPWYKSVHPATMWSILAMWDRTKMNALTRSGDAFIAHARNSLAKDFLKTKAEWSFWVDDDLILPCGRAAWFKTKTMWDHIPDQFAGLHTINRLMSHKKTLVGGLYTGRSVKGRPMYAEGMNDPGEAAYVRKKVPLNTCKPTRWIPTGCMLAHRSVFEDIVKKWPHLDNNWFTSSEHDVRGTVDEILKTGGEGLSVSDIMTRLQRAKMQSDANSKMGYGEDIQFCIRALGAGHQPYIDLAVVCAHVGGMAFGPHNTRG